MKPYLDEWLKAINDHGGFRIWQLAVSKGHANVKESWRMMPEDAKAKIWWR